MNRRAFLLSALFPLAAKAAPAEPPRKAALAWRITRIDMENGVVEMSADTDWDTARRIYGSSAMLHNLTLPEEYR
jgi:hypothetical protein